MDPLHNESENLCKKYSYKVLRNIVFKLAFWRTSNLSFLRRLANFVLSEIPQKWKDKQTGCLTGKQKVAEICTKSLSINTFMKDIFLVSLSSFQYCIPYWLYPENTTVLPRKVYKVFYWNFFLWFMKPLLHSFRNLFGHPETQCVNV